MESAGAFEGTVSSLGAGPEPGADCFPPFALIAELAADVGDAE
jgi:hypothetical protein